jgi:Lysyl oxidase
LRRASLVLATAGVLAAMMLVVVAVKMPAAAATDSLPDLGMYKLTGLRVETTTDGRKLLRFNSIIVNVGAGNFEVLGERPGATTTTMTTTQRIFDDAGQYRDVPTDAIMYYSGDGHNHWHVRDLQDYALIRLDNGVKVGTGAKHGFCFYDNYAFGSTQSAKYTRRSGACGVEGDLSVIMGLSVGWGDKYNYKLPDQYIDITELTSGRYRLQATADPQHWFLESNNSNNTTWVDIQLSGDQVSVLKRGGYVRPI